MLYMPWLRRGPWHITIRGALVLEATALQGYSVQWWLVSNGPAVC